MPSAMIFLTDGSHNTGLVNCFFNNTTISSGLQPGRIGSAEAFIQTVCMGLFILGSSSSRAAASLSWAGCISGVWNAPEVFKILACRAPAASTRGFKASMAFLVPPTAKPDGNSSFAIWQIAPAPWSFKTFSQSGCNFAFSRPATESISCSPTAAASCMASPRSLTNLRPSAKVKTPAAQSAVYSPRERPAMTEQRSTAGAFVERSFSTPARPPMNIAGWQNLVSSNFSSGPSKQSFKMS
mmetsp:Transcript_26040/g.74560  ORF Transcript_26040/g.74560 Transcript_26040/m.74560 type:complete len:240 (-) Transcript_26040:539-1258(-)